MSNKYDVLLINMHAKGLSAYLEKRPAPQYREPLGLLYLAAYLIKNNIKVKILDLNIKHFKNLNNIVKEALRYKPKIIGIPTFTALIASCLKLAKAIKKENKDIFIVFGGPHATFDDTIGLKSKLVDFVIRKEGELTLLELVETILDGQTDYSKIKGITYFANGKIKRNPDRPFIKNLDNLPFPKRNLLSSKYYMKGHRVNILTSRGCPYNCIFCVSPNFWNKIVRFRTPQNVDKELEEFFKRYKKILPKKFYINIADDTFTINKKRALDICEVLKKYNIPWFASSRINTVDEELLKKMKECGCIKIRFGIESGNQRILNILNKNQTIPQIISTIRLSKKYNLITEGSFMICNPTESKREVLRTIEFAKSIPLDFAFFFITVPYPGTDILKFCPKYFNRYDWTENLSSVDKVHIRKNFFDKNERMDPKEKMNLLAEAYYQFYVRNKKLTPPSNYNKIKDPLRKIKMLQSLVDIQAEKLGVFMTLTKFLGQRKWT